MKFNTIEKQMDDLRRKQIKKRLNLYIKGGGDIYLLSNELNITNEEIKDFDNYNCIGLECDGMGCTKHYVCNIFYKKYGPKTLHRGKLNEKDF